MDKTIVKHGTATPGGGFPVYGDAFAATLNEVPEERQRRYLQMAPKMLEWVHAKTRLRFMSVPRYADYNQQYPGAKPTRTMEPVFVDASQLGDSPQT